MAHLCAKEAIEDRESATGGKCAQDDFGPGLGVGFNIGDV
jgi:hypothetical protein